MFLAHSFRLRDPWQCEATDGGVRWSRIFHRPTGLEDDDALWLVCSGLPHGATVAVNGQALSPCATGVSPVSSRATGVPPVRTAKRVPASSTGDTPVPPPSQFEITAVVAESNHIEIAVPRDSQSPAPLSPDLAPRARGLAPSPFPYDVRLAIVGHS